MKNSFIPLVIIGLLLSASFGLVMMNHADGQGHGECPFKTTGVADCAQVQSPLDFMISHLNAFAKFSSATPVTSFVISLAQLLILAFSIPLILSKRLELFAPGHIFIQGHLRESFTAPSRILFNHWFALHENSPAFISGR